MMLSLHEQCTSTARTAFDVPIVCHFLPLWGRNGAIELWALRRFPRLNPGSVQRLLSIIIIREALCIRDVDTDAGPNEQCVRGMWDIYIDTVRSQPQ
jgi:hypothetical protein